MRKMPMRQEKTYVSLRDRQRRRRQGVIYNVAAIVLLFVIAINLLGTFEQVSELTMTDLDLSPLNFRDVEPVGSWHGEERQIVYLTFNSTPSANTAAILDLLAQEEVAATFFIQLEHLQNFAEADALLERIVAEGHFIGLDFVSHLQEGDGEAVVGELTQIQELVYEKSGKRSYLARPLFGRFNQNFLPEHAEALSESGFQVWDWHVDAHDWQTGISTSDILDVIELGMDRRSWPNQAVVSLQEQDITVASLPQIIGFFRNRGYHFGAYEPANHFPVYFY